MFSDSYRCVFKSMQSRHLGRHDLRSGLTLSPNADIRDEPRLKFSFDRLLPLNGRLGDT